jgi:hypothetical protein
MITAKTNGATGSAPVVQLDRAEREVLRDLVDLEATAVVADVLDARTADELDAAIVEVQHRSRLLRAVEDGVLTLDERTVEIIEAERAATLETLEHDGRSLAGQRAGDPDYCYVGMTAAESVRQTLRQMDRLLDEIIVHERLLGRAGVA